MLMIARGMRQAFRNHLRTLTDPEITLTRSPDPERLQLPIEMLDAFRYPEIDKRDLVNGIPSSKCRWQN